MFRLKLLGCTSAIALGFTAPAYAYPIDCAIFLCLAGGWPSSPDCNVAQTEFIRRITPLPVEPPLQLWRCPMGATSGSSNMSPMQRLDAIKSLSANPLPEFPGTNGKTPQVVDVTYSQYSWPMLDDSDALKRAPLGERETQLATVGAGSPAFPEPILANVNLSAPDFDVVRSIRVWHVRHYSYKVREREGPCETRLDMDVGSYDENASFGWSDRALSPRPAWLPLRRKCPSYYRGVGVEWSDSFGRYDYVLVPY
ncbi:hypothetical protein [Ruegeria arenilitoris]|uniref:hypothetical protein n=1 Tax=Ruegeria arenilitoris TaxID=1173585 RepID=UPI0014814BD9|nr:hypothetical protein [Ruegeria arenilitoris]